MIILDIWASFSRPSKAWSADSPCATDKPFSVEVAAWKWQAPTLHAALAALRARAGPRACRTEGPTHAMLAGRPDRLQLRAMRPRRMLQVRVELRTCRGCASLHAIRTRQAPTLSTTVRRFRVPSGGMQPLQPQSGEA